MKRSKLWSYPIEELQARVNRCDSIVDVLCEFGYSRTSGSMGAVVKRILNERNIDTSHFHTKPRVSHKHNGIPLESILVQNSTYTNINRLKIRILDANLLEYKCAICGNLGKWNDLPLTLQLDHIDGNHFNHTLSNLRFLCPNCHAQTDTYSGKNAKYGER